MIIDLNDPAIMVWQRNNMLLTRDGYTLQTLILADGSTECWAYKGEIMIRNDPPQAIENTRRMPES